MRLWSRPNGVRASALRGIEKKKKIPKADSGMPSRELWERGAWPYERGQRTLSVVDVLRRPRQSPGRRKENKRKISGNAALLFLSRTFFFSRETIACPNARALFTKHRLYDARDERERKMTLPQTLREGDDQIAWRANCMYNLTAQRITATTKYDLSSHRNKIARR